MLHRTRSLLYDDRHRNPHRGQYYYSDAYVS